MANNNRLGELLVREKLISLSQLRHAQDEQQKSGQNLGYTLARLGFISDGEITNFLSSQYRLPAINLDEYEIDGRRLHVLAKGRVVNLAAAPGHPASVMDLSFAAQALAVAAIAAAIGQRVPGVHAVAAAVDQEVARLKLASLGIQIDVLSEAQESYLRPFR